MLAFPSARGRIAQTAAAKLADLLPAGIAKASDRTDVIDLLFGELALAGDGDDILSLNIT